MQQSTAQFDIAVVITDGNPTVYGNAEGPGNYTRFREVENGIFSANAVKTREHPDAGVRGRRRHRRRRRQPRAPSPARRLNSDYFQTSNFGQVGTILRNLALGSCTGSVTVIKQVVPNTAPPGSITGATPAGGWTFGATTTTSGRDHCTGQRRDCRRNRRAELQPDLPGRNHHGAGGRHRDPAGRSSRWSRSAASTPCAPGRTPATDPPIPVPVTNTGALGFTVAANIAYGVTCTVYNRAPNPPAEIVVNKQWSITDTTSGTTTTYANGTQPSDLQAALTLGGTAQPFGVSPDRPCPGQHGRHCRNRHQRPARMRPGYPDNLADPTAAAAYECWPSLYRDPGRGNQLVHDHQSGHLHHQADAGQVGDRRPGRADGVELERDCPGRRGRRANRHHRRQRAGHPWRPLHAGRGRRRPALHPASRRQRGADPGFDGELAVRRDRRQRQRRPRLRRRPQRRRDRLRRAVGALHRSE